MKYFQFNKKKYSDIYSPGQDLNHLTNPSWEWRSYAVPIPGQLGPWTTRPVDSSARSGQLGPYIADNSARSGELSLYI